jgi:hypothetical protein
MQLLLKKQTLNYSERKTTTTAGPDIISLPEIETDLLCLPMYSVFCVESLLHNRLTTVALLLQVGNILRQLKEDGQNSLVACEVNITPIIDGTLPLYLLSK